MKFNEAIKYTKSKDELLDIKRKKAEPDEHVKTCKNSNVIDDPDEYPTENMYAWDTGISDRSPVGFTSDIKVLKQIDLMGGEEESEYQHNYRIMKIKRERK